MQWSRGGQLPDRVGCRRGRKLEDEKKQKTELKSQKSQNKTQSTTGRQSRVR